MFYDYCDPILETFEHHGHSSGLFKLIEDTESRCIESKKVTKIIVEG